MADSFQDPRNQADLDRLLKQLQAVGQELQAEVRGLETQISSEQAARRTALTEEQTAARQSGRGRGVIEDASAIKEGTAALDTRIAAQERLNALIEQQVKLEREAAAAVEGAARVAPAQGRYQSALSAQAAAEQEQLAARGAYTAGIRSQGSTTESNAALLATREEANRQAASARSETAAARKELDAAEAAAASRVRVAEELKTLEASIRQEVVAQQEEAVATQRAAQAAAARVAQSGQVVGQRGPLLLPAAGGTSASGSRPVFATGSSAVASGAEAAAVAEGNLGNAFSRASTQEAQAIAQMRDHGALTANFVGELARGNVTLHQFGSELGTTIGKFGGWAGAAALTYGALGAITDIGKGATQTSSAIQGLTRFLPDLDKARAARQLQEQAQSTVTPIAQVGDAAQSFARVFKNQDDVFTATHVALTASKLDNIALADSYRYLTALSQEYGLNAKQLPGIFDQVTAAQDRLGARVSQLLPALARSAAAIKNAGGTASEAIALESLALVRTGQTGNTVGTGFARGASNFFNVTGQSKTELAKLQIDPSQGFTKALAEAIGKAHTEGLSGTELTNLSKAFFGPLRGGLLASLFRASPEQVAKFTGETSPTSTQGLAERQLSKVTDQIDQVGKKFGINLEVLGSALSQSGLGAGAGAAARGVVGLTGDLGGLVNVFNQIPGPLKTAIEVLVAFRTTAALMSRTQFGQSVGNLPGFRTATNLIPGMRPSGERLRDQEISRVSTTTLASLDDSVASQLGSLAKLNAGEAEIEAEIRNINSRLASEVATAEERLALGERLATAETELAAQQEASLRAEAALTNTVSARQAVQANIVGVSKRAASGGYTEEQRSALGDKLGISAVALENQAQGTTLSAVVQNRYAQAKNKLGEALGRETMVSRSAASAEAASVSLFEGAATSVENMTTGLGGFIGSIGVFNAALIGLPFIISAFQSGAQAASDATAAGRVAVKAPTNNLTDLQNKLAAERTAANKAFQTTAQSTGDPLSGIPGVGTVVDTAANLADKAIGQFRDPTSHNQRAQQLQYYDDLYKGFVKQAQDDGASLVKTDEGRKKWYAELDRIKALASGTNKQAVSFFQSKGYADAAVLGAQSIKAFMGSLQSAYEQINSEATLPKIGGKQNPFASFAGLGAADIRKQIQGYTDRSTVYGEQADSQSIKQAIFGFSYLAGQERNSTTSTDLQALQLAQRNVVQTVTKNVQDQLRSATAATTFKGQGGDLSAALGDINKISEYFKTAIADLKKRYGANSAFVKAAELAAAQTEGQIQQYRQQTIQQQQSLLQSQGDVRTSSIGGISPSADIARQRSQLQTLEQKLASARSSGADASTIAALVAAINDQELAIYKAVTANARSIIEASGKLASASIQGISPEADIARARQSIANDQALLAFDQAHGAGTAAILSDQAQLLNDQRALEQSIQQNARSIIDAEASLKESSTNDPVAIARYALQGAEQLLAYDQQHAAGAATLLKDQADINNKRKALQQSIFDQQRTTIEFNYGVRNIDQATELDQLQALLKRMKRLHAPLASIQQLEQEIYNIIHDAGSNVNLNVGNIKTPSVYEVRSALASGQRSRSRAVTRDALAQIHQDVKVNVIVSKDADIRKVTDAVGSALHTNVSGVARAAGLI